MELHARPLFMDNVKYKFGRFFKSHVSETLSSTVEGGTIVNSFD
jgi:hypothetical protein